MKTITKVYEIGAWERGEGLVWRMFLADDEYLLENAKRVAIQEIQSYSERCGFDDFDYEEVNKTINACISLEQIQEHYDIKITQQQVLGGRDE